MTGLQIPQLRPSARPTDPYHPTRLHADIPHLAGDLARGLASLAPSVQRFAEEQRGVDQDLDRQRAQVDALQADKSLLQVASTNTELTKEVVEAFRAAGITELNPFYFQQFKLLAGRQWVDQEGYSNALNDPEFMGKLADPLFEGDIEDEIRSVRERTFAALPGQVSEAFQQGAISAMAPLEREFRQRVTQVRAHRVREGHEDALVREVAVSMKGAMTTLFSTAPMGEKTKLVQETQQTIRTLLETSKAFGQDRLNELVIQGIRNAAFDFQDADPDSAEHVIDLIREQEFIPGVKFGGGKNAERLDQIEGELQRRRRSLGMDRRERTSDILRRVVGRAQSALAAQGTQLPPSKVDEWVEREFRPQAEQMMLEAGLSPDDLGDTLEAIKGMGHRQRDPSRSYDTEAFDRIGKLLFQGKVEEARDLAMSSNLSAAQVSSIDRILESKKPEIIQRARATLEAAYSDSVPRRLYDNATPEQKRALRGEFIRGLTAVQKLIPPDATEITPELEGILHEGMNAFMAKSPTLVEMKAQGQQKDLLLVQTTQDFKQAITVPIQRMIEQSFPGIERKSDALGGSTIQVNPENQAKQDIALRRLHEQIDEKVRQFAADPAISSLDPASQQAEIIRRVQPLAAQLFKHSIGQGDGGFPAGDVVKLRASQTEHRYSKFGAGDVIGTPAQKFFVPKPESQSFWSRADAYSELQTMGATYWDGLKTALAGAPDYKAAGSELVNSLNAQRPSPGRAPEFTTQSRVRVASAALSQFIKTGKKPTATVREVKSTKFPGLSGKPNPVDQMVNAIPDSVEAAKVALQGVHILRGLTPKEVTNGKTREGVELARIYGPQWRSKVSGMTIPFFGTLEDLKKFEESWLANDPEANEFLSALLIDPEAKPELDAEGNQKILPAVMFITAQRRLLGYRIQSLKNTDIRWGPDETPESFLREALYDRSAVDALGGSK